VIKRIGVTYHFSPGEEVDRAVVERVRGFHAEHCPVACSIAGAIEVSTDVVYT
jgi:uncharacterized OsmC-like protein